MCIEFRPNRFTNKGDMANLIVAIYPVYPSDELSLNKDKNNTH